MREDLGDRAGALAFYRKAIRLDWYRASYHLQAGRLAANLGRAAEARSDLQNALALFPLWVSLNAERSGEYSIAAETLRAAQEDARRRLAALR